MSSSSESDCDFTSLTSSACVRSNVIRGAGHILHGRGSSRHSANSECIVGQELRTIEQVSRGSVVRGGDTQELDFGPSKSGGDISGEEFEIVYSLGFEEAEAEEISFIQEGPVPVACQEAMFDSSESEEDNQINTRSRSKAMGSTREHVHGVDASRLGDWRDPTAIAEDSESSTSHSTSSERSNLQEEANGNVRASRELDALRTTLHELVICEFQNIHTRSRVLHDIYVVRTQQRTMDCLLGSVPKCTGGAFAIICLHGDHVHAVHDCTYHSNSCRCAFTRWLEDRFRTGRRGRRIIPADRWSVKLFENTLQYFQKGSRHMYYLQIGRKQYTQQSPKGGSNAIRLSRECAQDVLVEECGHTRDGQLFVDCGGGNSELSTTPGCSSDGQGNEAGVKQGVGAPRKIRSTGGRIHALLEKYPTAPLSQLFQTSYWTSSEFKYFHRGQKLIGTVLNNRALELMEYSIREFQSYFNSLDPQHLLFNAPLGKVGEYHLPTEESVEILDLLLQFQFEDNEEDICRFLTDLRNIVDKRIPKVNTLFVVSPPNAGKNFFFDCVIHFFLNFGQIGNFNKYSSFPLQEAVQRILLWNEPLMEPGAEETLKTLFGGDTCNVKVKYSADAIKTRTPIIVLSNGDIFPKNRAFRSRMVTCRWKSAPFLKHVRLEPYPLAFVKLLEKYDILSEEEETM